ncbi:hypothetical protein L6164_014433 [Bauhinia variegata]|uniref:Uncharacterized protein n=1 Tax=Bauhinia variegata TaxID=167791 RepID=A0ACB9NJ95_BAUVA|nr:hypothetical protein L6164_014433 [Bauhinia variegata]
MIYDYPLENGLGIGIYRAILVAQVGRARCRRGLKVGWRTDLRTLFHKRNALAVRSQLPYPPPAKKDGVDSDDQVVLV